MANPETVGLVQLVVQGGALALLAWFLIWDFPRSRREQREERDEREKSRVEERDKHDALTSKLAETFREECREQRELYREESKAQREACEAHFTSVVSAVGTLGDELHRHHEMAQSFIAQNQGQSK